MAALESPFLVMLSGRLTGLSGSAFFPPNNPLCSGFNSHLVDELSLVRGSKGFISLVFLINSTLFVLP